MSMSIVLKAGGDRTLVSTSEAESIRDRFRSLLMKKSVGCCWKLDLSCRAWTVPTLQIVLEGIAAKIVPTVQVLKFDDIIASVETEQGLAVFEYLANLFANAPLVHTLNLNDNAIGIRGMEKLAPLFTSLPSLRALHFYNCGMSAEVGDRLCQLLSPIAMRLTSLSLGRNQMGIEGAKSIGTLLQNCQNLQHFYYAGSRPLVEGTRYLCRGLAILARNQDHTQLITLDLNDCNLKSGEDYNDEKEEELDLEDDDTDIDPIVYLALVLKRSPFLQTLIVQGGELEVPGLKRLLDHVHPRLCELDIGGNGTLGGTGGELIRDYLVTSTSLRKLVCDANELGDEGIIPIAMGAAACESIHEINLESNDITQLGAKALLLNPIPHLVTLNLQDNMDLPQSYAKKLQSMYATVLVDEDLPEEEEEEEEEESEAGEEESDVADLTSAMAASHI